MKHKIILLAGILLLGSAAWVWAEVPQQISFAGETFVFAKDKEEGGVVTYSASAREGGIVFWIFAPSDSAQKDTINPVSAAHRKLQECEENNDLYHNCKLDYCDNENIVLSRDASGLWVDLFRYTKTKLLWIKIHSKELRAPVSQYRRALCQLDI